MVQLQNNSCRLEYFFLAQIVEELGEKLSRQLTNTVRMMSEIEVMMVIDLYCTSTLRLLDD